MDQNEIKTVLESHRKWLNGDGGSRANLRYADLRDANLRYADLRDANLRGADLRDADLRDADLRYADLRDANLRGANLRGANLRYANLRDANLRGADLRDADLRYADLRDADLRGANLRGANLRYADLRDALFYPLQCPETGSFVAYKKASGKIVKLLVPEDAFRSSATSRKCRCSKAIVVSIENVDGSPCDVSSVRSNYDKDFVYKVGETVAVENFCRDRFCEYAPGIHFFITRQEAVDY